MRKAINAAGADVTSTLQAFLQTTDHFSFVDLYLFLLPFGAPFFGGFLTFMPIASSEVPIAWQGLVYLGTGTRVTRGQLTSRIGVDVDTLDITLHPRKEDGSLDVIPGTSLALTQAAQAGLFDDALLTLWRVFLTEPPRYDQAPGIVGGVMLFHGSVSEPEADRHKVALRVRSRLDLLDQKIPRNVYQPSCLNSLYDTVCGLSPTGSAAGRAFQATPTVGAGSDTLTVPLSSLASYPDGYFDLGYLQIGAGSPFQGLRRGIKRFVSNPTSVTLYKPLPFVLGTGQAVTLQAGCDKSLDTCVAKFANRNRFRGFPYVPTPETAL